MYLNGTRYCCVALHSEEEKIQEIGMANTAPDDKRHIDSLEP